MKKLKIILQHNYFYVFIVIVTVLIIFFFTKVKFYESKYKLEETSFYCTVKKIQYKDEYVSLKLKCKENLTGIYYFKPEEQKEKIKSTLSLGDKLYITGNLKIPTNNTNPNVFNYKKYLYYNRQFYTLNIKTYVIIKKNKNPLYYVKNSLLDYLNIETKTNAYIKTFVLGDDSSIDENLIDAYKKLGISHLFSVSGMHISLIMGIITFILKKCRIKERFSLIVMFFSLFLLMYLVDFTPSVLRSGMLFLICRLNKVFKLELSIIKCFFISIFLNVIIDPFVFYKIGFIYSALISFYLIIFREVINKRKNYFIKLLMTSFVSWIVSIPINLYNFFEINILTVFYNLIFVPIISIVIFPCCLLVTVFRFLTPILNFLIIVFEQLVCFFSKIETTLIFAKPNFLLIIIYFVIITYLLYQLNNNKLTAVILLIVILLLHYNWNFIFKNNFLVVLDVGQGDALILNINNRTILLDTGKENKKNSNDIITVLKSNGTKRIDYMIITHGDYDHMGEAINLIENFKVEKVIFNCGEFNELEQDLIEVLDKKKIPYYSCIKELNMDDNKLYFLNNKDYGNENDNSSVIYTDLNKHKFLFMGDAGVEVEQDLIEKYNLQDIDVLKVGHHGSKTSSSKKFVDEINPKYSIISVGKNNRYGHPNKTVLENLEKSKIYRTDIQGSIMFKIKN